MEIPAIVIAIIAVAALFFYIQRDKSQQNQNEDQKLMFEYIESLRKEIRDNNSEIRKESNERLEKIDERLAKGLRHSSETLQKQFSDSTKLISDVTKELTHLKETNKQVLGFSEKMQSLENILKNPKQRGILGEYFLETLLAQVLPPTQYQMQYKFSSGEIVDAAIFYQEQIIPIDSKFSLEKYNKIMEESRQEERDRLEKEFKMDIKKRIDETSKYIRPKENTTDFAFMFIPAEGIYYNLLIYKVGTLDVNANDLIEYAFSKRVIIVSPTSFFAYLQTVLQGLKAQSMQDSLQEIIKNVGQLGKHLNSYETYMQKLGNNLGTTVNMYNSAYKEFKKVDKDVHKITGEENDSQYDPIMLDRPNQEI